jgi:hypothetical protein
MMFLPNPDFGGHLFLLQDPLRPNLEAVRRRLTNKNTHSLQFLWSELVSFLLPRTGRPEFAPFLNDPVRSSC